MQLVGRDGTFISLSPVAYEFAATSRDRWVRNWLVIAGKVDSEKGQWTFRDTALTAFEAKEIGPWLRGAGNGSVPISHVDPDGEVEPDLSFTEPSLAFSVSGRESDAVGLRIHFSHGTASPQLDFDERFAQRFYIELTMGPDDLTDAAAQWEHELKSFPERGRTPRWFRRDPPGTA